MRSLICTILAVLFACPLWAAPSLTNATITGTIADGETITISGGSGFGATGPTVLVFDDFEGGSNESAISTAVNGATVNRWNYIGAIPPFYSNSYAHSGSLSECSDWSSDGAEEGSRFVGIHGTSFSVVYFSFWAYLPTNRNIPGTNGGLGANFKVYHIYTDPYPSNNYASQILTDDLPDPSSSATHPIGTVNDDGNGKISYGWGEPPGCIWTKGRWVRWEVYAVADRTDGLIQQWQMDSANARAAWGSPSPLTGPTVNSTGQTWTAIDFPYYGRGDTNSQTYYDDIYVATGSGARARVEIGNNATYSSCTNLTVCTPTSWSDTSITATVRGGSFTSGTAYLFVTDASGVTSAGKEITFGSGSSPSTPTIRSGSVRNGGIRP